MCKNIKQIISIAITFLASCSVAFATGITMGLTKTEGVMLVFFLYFIIPSIVLFLVYIPANIYVKKHKPEHIKKLKASYFLLVLILLLWVTAGVI